jgi:preprotein translocase subunit SecE
VNKIIEFFKETRTEMTKVAWPTKNEVVGSTIVTVVVSIILSIFVGIVDFGLDKVVRSIF